MSDPVQLPSDSFTEILARLSKKPGVKATLVIDRQTGALIKTTGPITALQPSSRATARLHPETSAAAMAATTAAPADGEPPMSPSPAGPQGGGGFGDDGPDDREAGERAATEWAGLVWKFVRSAGDLVGDLWEEEDEVKLLRVRSKRQELVIVPDAKYLLVLVHDTPVAQ